MLVETYECETVPSEECSEEARTLAEKLGAAGQEAFYRATGPVLVYRKMTPVELAVYSVLLPIHETIKDYKAGPIPLRVLQVGSHAVDLLNGPLIVWHAGIGKTDPLLTLREGSEYSGSYYLLARWGEELEEFAVLKQKAIQSLAAKVRAEFASIRGQVESLSASIEDKIVANFEKGSIEKPHFYW